MDLEQLKANWQQQLAQKPSDELLVWGEGIAALEKKMKAMDRNVKTRTIYGTITFVLILFSIIALSYFSHLVGAPLMSMLGHATFGVLIVVTMTRTLVVKKRYNMNDNTLTIQQSLQHKLAKVENEIQFYLSLVWTVLVPMLPGFVLISIGSNASWIVTTVIIIFFILCCYFSYRYNKYYVTKNLTPIKAELLVTLKALQ